MVTVTLNHLPPDHFCTFMHHVREKIILEGIHNHDFHELFWVEDSQGFHWINGERFPVQSGDLVLIRASDCHTFGSLPGLPSLRIVNFAFRAPIWTHIRKRYFDGASVFFSHPTIAGRSFRLDEQQMAAVRQSASQLRSGLRDRLQTETFLLSVLALLKADPFQATGKPVPDWIREACAALSSNRNFAGGVPALARMAKRSPEHLAREFRRYLGRTPTEIINDARMSYAADRLATTDEPIVTISLDCGLENLGHFYRLFQGRHGCTPQGYRQRQKSVIRLDE